MNKYIYLFDLDGIISREAIFPIIAKQVGKSDEMISLLHRETKEITPYKKSFLDRVDILKDISVSEISNLIDEIELNNKIIDFIQNNKERCYIVTGYLDVWIYKLMNRIGMYQNLFCSKAIVKNDRIIDVLSLVDKSAVINQMLLPCVAVGDGHNDAEMICESDIGIGYGGTGSIASSVMENASHIIYDEDTLVRFLNKLL